MTFSKSSFNELSSTYETLLLLRKKTETFFRQTKTKSQETLKIKLNKPYETLLFNTNLTSSGFPNHEVDWFLGLTSFDVFFFVCNINQEKNIHSTYTPGHYEESKTIEKTEILIYSIKMVHEIY